MDMHTAEEFAIPIPVLPPETASCDGIPREKWITKCASLKNEAGEDVANAIIRSVDPDVVIDMDGQPLGVDRVAVQIAESLCEVEVPSAWMWSMHSWLIQRVFVNGVSLYDQDRTHVYNTAMKALNGRVRVGVHAYESSRERVELEGIPKKESLLTAQAIAAVSSKTCCSQNCLQPFPRREIQAIRLQLHQTDGVYSRKKCLLEVHGQTHKDSSGKEWITLRNFEVYPTAWWTIHGILKATFYRYKDMAKDGKQAKGHGNLGLKKPQLQTV